MDDNKELEQDLRSAGILIEKLSKSVKPKEDLKELKKANKTFTYLLIALCVTVAVSAGMVLFNAGYHAGVEAATYLYEVAVSYSSAQ